MIRKLDCRLICKNTILLFLAAAQPMLAEPYRPSIPSPELREEQKRISKLSFDDQLAALRLLNPEMQRQHADAIRNFDPELGYLNPNQRVESIPKLLALNDPATGAYMAAELERRKHPVTLQDFRFWRAPGAVPVLARLADSDENYTINAPSFIAAGMLLALLPSLEAFPESVRQWAARVPTEGIELFRQARREAEALPRDRYNANWAEAVDLPNRTREIVRKWWAENARALTEGRYSEVKPGEKFAEPSKFLPGLKQAVSVPVPTPPPAPAPPVAVGSPTVIPAEPQVTIEPESRLWLWLSAGLCALGGVCYWVFRGLKSKA